MGELMWLDATAQADLVRRGEVTPLELVEDAIATIEAVNPAINAVIHTQFDEARAAARGALADGPFKGVPTLLKDVAGFEAGQPMHLGTRFLRSRDLRAREDSFVTAALRRAGFVFVGRTNTPEFANQATTEPLAYGATANPWDTTRSAGGSSGGAGAAVAAGMVAVAHGNDGGGSIRIPASINGLVGLKPSRGRTSFAPEMGDSPGGIAVQGLLCRTVRDAAATLDAIIGSAPGDPYVAPPPARPFTNEVGAPIASLRIGVVTRAPDGYPATPPEVAAAVTRTGETLASLGHTVTDVAPPMPPRERMATLMLDLWSVETASMFNPLRAAAGRDLTADEIEPVNLALAARGNELSAGVFVHTVESLTRLCRRLLKWWEQEIDVLVAPTVSATTPRLGETVSAEPDLVTGWVAHFDRFPFTPLFNTTGQPAMSLPLATFDDGMPIGVQLVAPPYREDVLIRLGCQLEEAMPWTGRRPVL